ncbi:MAG: hypothetical protein Q4G70_00340 [Pseudomonadota bacterium]|nr:hypothetical protein [Pseudomonadota bacterium]
MRVHSPHAQKGITLLMALIALVALSLASVALIRSVDTGLVIAGNQAFKEACLGAADRAVEDATTWLNSQNKTALLTTNAAEGYYAEWMTGQSCDVTGNQTLGSSADDVQWKAGGTKNANCSVQAKAATNMPADYSASYTITRMCDCQGTASGAPTGTCADAAGNNRTKNVCVGVATASGGRFRGTADYNYRILNKTEGGGDAAGLAAYYRIVARTVCPRNTTSFVETIVLVNP